MRAQRADDRVDLPRGVRGADGEGPDLVGDHRETAPVVPGLRRDDRRVQREQTGLLGDVVDDPRDRADPLDLPAQLGDRGRCRGHALPDPVHAGARAGHRPVPGRRRGRHALREGGRLLEAALDLSHRGVHLGHARRRPLQRLRQVPGRPAGALDGAAGALHRPGAGVAAVLGPGDLLVDRGDLPHLGAGGARGSRRPTPRGGRGPSRSSRAHGAGRRRAGRSRR